MIGCAMRIFAAGIGNLIEVVLFLVVLGVMAINKILAARKEEQAMQPPVRRLPNRPPPRAGVNPMEPQDVDQFLDEVLGRGGQRPQPQKEPPVIILRPTNVPPVPQVPAPLARPRQEVRRPVPRVVVPRSVKPAGRQGRVPPVPPPEQKTRSKFSESVQKDVDQAAAATQEAAALRMGTTLETTRRNTSPHDIIAMLRSPADVRRAILLYEILGPPKARRRP